MDFSILEKSVLFSGVSSAEIAAILDEITYHIRYCDKGETVFHLMEEADRIGIILDGKIEAQMPFPNGNQLNLSIRMSGEMIGPAAVFSKSRRYPCDMVASVPATLIIFRKDELIRMMRRDVRILENLTAELATATQMMQQKLELLSYRGIAQKAAFWLLIQARQTGKDSVPIPDSISKWAMLMNVSRTSLHRELKKLDARKIIKYSPSTIKILDFEELYDVLNK